MSHHPCVATTHALSAPLPRPLYHFPSGPGGNDVGRGCFRGEGGISMQCYHSNCETAGSGRTPAALQPEGSGVGGKDLLYCNTLLASPHPLLSPPSHPSRYISQSSSIILGMLQGDLTRLTLGFCVILPVCYSLLSSGFCLFLVIYLFFFFPAVDGIWNVSV